LNQTLLLVTERNYRRRSFIQACIEQLTNRSYVGDRCSYIAGICCGLSAKRPPSENLLRSV